MCAPNSKSYRAWNRVFLISEVLALLGCAYAIIGAICYRYYSNHHIMWRSGHISVRILEFGETFLRPMFWSFIGALLVLLILSPFFLWSSLRPAAVKAWSIGLLALVCAVYALSRF
jgi:hypothetical protein